MRLAGAIFDLDGTLVDSLPIAIEAFRRAIERFTRRELSNSEISALFGPSEAGVLRLAVPDHWQEAVEIYAQEYKKLYQECNIRPFPGIVEALNLLQAHRVLLAVVTGKSAAGTAFSLNYSGLAGYFDLTLSGSPDGAIKPALLQQALARWSALPEQVFYLGDSPSDIQDARQVGMLPLGAAWSPAAQIAELADQAPLAVFATTGKLIEWLNKLW